MRRSGQVGIVLAVLLAVAIVTIKRQHTRAQMHPFGSFSYVAGLFKHDQQPTGPDSGFRAQTLPSLGIVERSYPSDSQEDVSQPQWQRLVKYIQHLNAASSSERYKVLFVIRHGEGVHNLKERQVGRPEWERYWSRIDGDGSLAWVNGRLTEKGIQQAKAVASFWRDAMEVDKIPAPERIFTSPLARCLQTTKIAWSGLFGDHTALPVVVSEALRELFGVHVCDKRGTRSEIQFEFPEFTIEPGLTEADELWTAERRETLEDHTRLWLDFLQRLFNDDHGMFVSLTSHSGATRALYAALGHPDVWTASGSIVPIVVRGQMTNSTA